MSAKRPGATLPTHGVSRMWRAGLIVTHWIAISGDRPDSIARRTLWSVAPMRSVSEALRSSVAKAICDQSARPRWRRPGDDLRHRMRPDLHEYAVAQLFPDLLGQPSFVVRCEAGGGEGIDGTEITQSRPVTLDNSALLERRSDHSPKPLCDGFSGFQTAGQSITSSRPATIRL